MSVLVWSMVGIALWHFTVLLPGSAAALGLSYAWGSRRAEG